MADGGLERIALDVQRQLAANGSQSVVDSLKLPTRQSLFAAGSALLAAGELDVAESLYRMLSE
ncbi:MAG TPA: hypothetical protein VF835_05215, partial [Rhizomicrobium sp.]